ncbi:cob(I)yrinic acid a,c-diamide adenosyltransferase [Marinobacterium mangrovicola]|uniref:Corrinoid adenosyltransferase n=1 Tax=Marinobacterium mangrovicola TaxID=1476959 RepID=A0A4R1G966_9GAMM|nr:cob(I)yrinic acid a,c-diamide adenosyltransferase [Marinobacterium mangrovicola]TCK04707.1 cob(I)yrinic acid a,c-diamide adenosyltransferase [Marinobacterium mangrovicola]
MSEDALHKNAKGNDADQRYKDRMVRKKAVVDQSIARADQDRGVLLVLTGNGKGKSSSAFGMLARALGHGMQVGVVQFIKGSYSTGEEAFFRRFPEVRYHVMGEGFTWETQDKERDRAAAQAAWDVASELLSDESVSLVVLDELNIALKYNYVELDQVLEAVAKRPAMQHVVITGRGAPQALIDVADTVTEMQVVKHAFKAGVRAQKGVEL